MEWQTIDELSGKVYRKFSNEAMRKLKLYIDYHKLKKITEGYNETLDRESIYLSNKRERTEEEKLEDREVE